MKKAEEIGASRRMNSLTLNRHTEILEILEIPQLMDTCVRNNYYEEALELAAYAKRLEKKHSTLPVIQVTPTALEINGISSINLKLKSDFSVKSNQMLFHFEYHSLGNRV